jgi:hypothetical protein
MISSGPVHFVTLVYIPILYNLIEGLRTGLVS